MESSQTTTTQPQEISASGKQAKKRSPLHTPGTISRAQAWKREEVARMEAEIQIAQALLRMKYEELAALNKKTGPELTDYFLVQSPVEVEKAMRSARQAESKFQAIWIEGEFQGTTRTFPGIRKSA